MGINESLRNMGINVIVKDSLGEVFTTLSTPKMYIIYLVVAEAFAIMRAIVLCKELGQQMVKLEGDAF
jgi:hypothetical protein